jgi:hypothetical protein
MTYNKTVFLGPYDECGKIDIFQIWHEHVHEKKAKRMVEALIDHY